MSIYSKQVSNLTYRDIHDLLSEQATENVRLEFKSKFPKRSEMLKKLSSFANTYGGYMVIGAIEDGNGNLIRLDGVTPEPGHKQKVIQWCYEHLSPPITPMISDAIPDDNSPAKVLYVIYVEQSRDAPHFINGRKGCYIRTDEFSQTFEPRLATYEELKFLLERRAESVQLRQNVIERAKQRFRTFSKGNPDRKNDSTMTISISPVYPFLEIVGLNDLRGILQKVQVLATTDHGKFHLMPSRYDNQHDGVFSTEPQFGNDASYFEASIQGLLFFATQAAIKSKSHRESYVIYADEIILWIAIVLRCATQFYQHSGYEGMLLIELGFEHVQQQKFSLARHNQPQSTPFDDSYSIVVDTSTLEIENQTSAILASIAYRVIHSFGGNLRDPAKAVEMARNALERLRS